MTDHRDREIERLRADRDAWRQRATTAEGELVTAHRALHFRVPLSADTCCEIRMFGLATTHEIDRLIEVLRVARRAYADPNQEAIGPPSPPQEASGE